MDEDEDLFSPVPRAFRRRVLWLGINLCTAFLASSVVLYGIVSSILLIDPYTSCLEAFGGSGC